MIDPQRLQQLRSIVIENIRVQRGGPKTVPYIDVSNALNDAVARQNHVIFGRRGCGKTLLLTYSGRQLPIDTRAVYLNCEDFKNHSFPNVLIEILDAVFAELASKLTGWFGRKKRSRELIASVRREFQALARQEDEAAQRVRETTEQSSRGSAGLTAGAGPFLAAVGAEDAARVAIEREYQSHDSKIQRLNQWLPRLKRTIREFFEISRTVKFVFIQVDDFYHLRRVDQPHVMDYLHRLCKDLPMYFKLATLRHASVLFAERDEQPTGAQERHDYQPINIDFTLENFRRTEEQNWTIFCEYARLANIAEDELSALFKGEGFRRLVLAGGGVPRDCLSLFLETLDNAQAGDGRIGKDDVRILSLMNFERRIEELKKDSQRDEQDVLLRAIYVLRRFCIDKKNSTFHLPERLLQENENVRQLMYRLLDYRIVHLLGTAFTHKTVDGTFQAFMIDVGSYAFMRKLARRLTEIDLAQRDAKERIRSCPVVTYDALKDLWDSAPADVESALRTEEPGE